MFQDAAERHGTDRATSWCQDLPSSLHWGQVAFLVPRKTVWDQGAPQVWGTGDSLAPIELGGSVLLGTGDTPSL